MHERYHKEYNRFLALATAAGIKPDSNGSLPAARSFAEELVLCPTEKSVVVLVEGNRRAAATFLDVAAFFNEKVEHGIIGVDKEPAEGSLPFFVLSGAVLEFLQGLRERHPQGFE